MESRMAPDGTRPVRSGPDTPTGPGPDRSHRHGELAAPTAPWLVRRTASLPPSRQTLRSTLASRRSHSMLCPIQSSALCPGPAPARRNQLAVVSRRRTLRRRKGLGHAPFPFFTAASGLRRAMCAQRKKCSSNETFQQATDCSCEQDATRNFNEPGRRVTEFAPFVTSIPASGRGVRHRDVARDRHCSYLRRLPCEWASDRVADVTTDSVASPSPTALGTLAASRAPRSSARRRPEDEPGCDLGDEGFGEPGQDVQADHDQRTGRDRSCVVAVAGARTG